MNTLNQYWRVLATGFCFLIFGLGGLILSFVIIPIISLFHSTREEKEYRVQEVIQISFRSFCSLMILTRAIDVKITGAEKLKKDKNCLIVANHPSLIDYVLITSQLRHCDCIVKSEIWSNPFIKHVVQAAGYIPNKAPMDMLSICEERFDRGNRLLIFPEGTRTTPGVKSKLQRGSAQIAVRTKRDLRLVHITVSPDFLTKEKKWYQVPATKPFFHIEVKDKIEVRPFIDQADSLSIAARHLQQHLSEVLFP